MLHNRHKGPAHTVCVLHPVCNLDAVDEVLQRVHPQKALDENRRHNWCVFAIVRPVSRRVNVWDVV